jgi:hypothetical protein
MFEFFFLYSRHMLQENSLKFYEVQIGEKKRRSLVLTYSYKYS